MNSVVQSGVVVALLARRPTLVWALTLALMAPAAALAQVEVPDFDDDSFSGWILDRTKDGGVNGDGPEPTLPDDTELFPFTDRVLVQDMLNGTGCPAPARSLATWEVRTVWGPGPDQWTLEGWEHLCSDGSTVYQPFVPPTSGVGGAAGTAPSSPADTVVHAAIRESLPIPTTGLSPKRFGVTGLATWFWFEHGDPSALTPVDHDGNPATPPVPGITASATEDGWTISATVWVSEYRWELSDGTVLRSDRPGSANSPAAEHVWVTKDPTSQVTIVASWTGRYAWSAPGDSGTGSMGRLDMATAVPYPVREIRAVPAD